MTYGKDVIAETERFVTNVHAFDHTGHDVAHLDRVRRLAESLCDGLTVNRLVVTLSALLHDVEDHKLGREAGLVKRHLDSLDISDEVSRHVLDVIAETSYSKGKTPSSLESAIIQDADRLDAMGAIGIARTFQYAGASGTALYGDTSAISHFHEKLLRLGDGMHTDAAKRIARERHAYLLSFLERFEAEWNGNDI
ncbi:MULTISPECIES: HD domain-containing protein [Exiguobacterium]|uniref:HD domain-containing protein n=1 Tax=Exiguobacterium TaxID=33986 RepID=UPI001BE8AC80|nr:MULTISPECIES: HD domain-containing protein [Exiguobacterium]MCT4782222.1 metal-dependent phosphohydrolase [Exiguobacterium himgiriensis]